MVISPRQLVVSQGNRTAFLVHSYHWLHGTASIVLLNGREPNAISCQYWTLLRKQTSIKRNQFHKMIWLRARGYKTTGSVWTYVHNKLKHKALPAENKLNGSQDFSSGLEFVQLQMGKRCYITLQHFLGFYFASFATYNRHYLFRGSKRSLSELLFLCNETEYST
jgi:hypothetical protein